MTALLYIPKILRRLPPQIIQLLPLCLTALLIFLWTSILQDVLKNLSILILTLQGASPIQFLLILTLCAGLKTFGNMKILVPPIYCLSRVQPFHLTPPNINLPFINLPAPNVSIFQQLMKFGLSLMFTVPALVGAPITIQATGMLTAFLPIPITLIFGRLKKNSMTFLNLMPCCQQILCKLFYFI